MNFDWKGHASMLGANVMWGLMSPVSKVILVGGAITPLVITDFILYNVFFSKARTR